MPLSATNNQGATQGATATSHSAGGGLVTANGAVANATASANVDSYIGSNTTINQAAVNPAGTVAITASSTNIAIATADGTNIGVLVAVGASKANATVSGQTNAYLDGDITAPRRRRQGGRVNIQAGSADLAVAQSYAAGGGLISDMGKGDNVATATIQPPTNDYSARAYLGKNRNVFVTGNITVQGQETPEADSQIHGVSGGGIQVGDPHPRPPSIPPSPATSIPARSSTPPVPSP